MKRFRGFNNVHFAVATAFGLLVLSVAFCSAFSGNQFKSYTAQLKSQPESSARQVVPNKYKYQPVYTNANSFPVQTITQEQKNLSLEGMIKQNIANAGYVQTSGASGVIKNETKKEISQIMNEYAVQINKEILISSIWFNNSTPERSITVFNNFKTDMDNFITATSYTTNLYSDAPQKSQLLTNLALLNMTLYFNTPIKNNKTPIETISEDFEVYIKAIPDGEYKNFITEKMQQLIGFSAGIKYSIDPNLYKEKLGQSPNGTLAQDQMLADKLLAEINSFTEPEKIVYASKIGVYPST
jgi:hypothetical protein